MNPEPLLIGRGLCVRMRFAKQEIIALTMLRLGCHAAYSAVA
jgi:hypothetical protein